MNALDSIVQFDHSATLWVNNLASWWNDGFWWLMSDVQIWFPVYALFMVYALWRLGWKKGLAVILSIVLTVVLVDQLANLVKFGVARLRPFWDADMVNGGLRIPYDNSDAGLYGFFSAHAGNSFGFAVTSYLGLKWNRPEGNFKVFGWVVFLWAALMSLSRTMMGAHFLGDITVGALVGLGVGFLMALLARLVVVKVTE